jgi:hypothetical protein
MLSLIKQTSDLFSPPHNSTLLNRTELLTCHCCCVLTNYPTVVLLCSPKPFHLEERAFLSSEYKAEVPVVAMIKGVEGMWDVKGALYGLRTPPRDSRERCSRFVNEVQGEEDHV